MNCAPPTVDNSPPQLQFIVVLGSQYAALAKNEKGANDDIWDDDRGAIDSLRL